MHCKISIYIVDSTFSRNRFPETYNTIVGEGFCFVAVRSSHISVVVGITLSNHILHVESVFLMSACKHRRIVCKWFRKCCQLTKIKLVGRKNMIFSIDKTVVFVNRMEKKDYFSW